MTSVATSSTKSLPPLGRGYKREHSSRPGTSQPYNLEGYEEIFEMMSEEKNPFALPPDELIFTFKEKEIERKAKQRQENSLKRIWEKFEHPRAKKIREMAGAKVKMTEIAVNKRYLGKQAGAIEERGLGFDLERKVSKESRHKIIEKKREMFHMQMMLNTKQRQIQKLEQKEDMLEKGLTISEKMLSEDSQAFEKFCRGVADDLSEANQLADARTRLKQKKQAEYKHKSDLVDTEQSRITKYFEILTETNKYREFLTEVAPKNYQEEVKRRKKDREYRKQADLSIIMEKASSSPGMKSQIKRNVIQAHTQVPKKSMKSGAVSGSKDLHQIPSQIEELIDEQDDDMEPPFTDVDALNEKFRQYEEKNLILVQTTQDLEEQIEENEAQFEKKKEHYENQIKQLKQTIAELERRQHSSVSEVQKNIGQLDKHQDSDKEKKVIRNLEEKIQKIYRREKLTSSVAIGDSRMNGLQMMTYIESKMEGLMTSLSQLDQEKVDKKMKEKDRENRKKKQIAKLKLEQEKQRRKQLDKKDDSKRFKYPGKPVMFRSEKPAAKKKEVKKQELSEEQKDYLKYMA